MQPFTAALIQQAFCQNNQENLAKTIHQVAEAAMQGATLILLPELHASPYFCQIEDPAYFLWAESIEGETISQLRPLAKQLSVVIVASIFEQRAAGLYHNTAVVIEKNGEIAGIYRKMHIPDDPAYYEKFYFTPGDLGFNPIQTSLGKLGVLVCWDQWFPEAARLMTLKGADLLLYPTAIGFDPEDSPEEHARQLHAWQISQQGHAIANGLHVLSCNRMGFEPHPKNAKTGIQFWGNSFICGPQGEILIQASKENEEIIFQPIDLTKTATVRNIWPFLRDRRIDAYEGLLKRYIDG